MKKKLIRPQQVPRKTAIHIQTERERGSEILGPIRLYISHTADIGGLPTQRREVMKESVKNMTLMEATQWLTDEYPEQMVRVFDVRYATEGVPIIGKDFLFFPTGSWEVLETGSLSKPTQQRSLLTYPKLVPESAILLVEVSPSKRGGKNAKGKTK